MRLGTLRDDALSRLQQLAVGEWTRFLVWTAGFPLVLLLGHALPDSAPGLALRLAGAAGCILVLPGALILRAVAWPSSLALAAAAAVALSLAVDAVALGVVFLAGSSLDLALVVVAVVCACAAVPALLRGPTPGGRISEHRAVGAVFGVSALFAVAVWWAAAPVRSDGFFHLARVRKLLEFDSLGTLSIVNEFEADGLHPGYAFPLWHGVDGLVARLAGADPTDVIVYLPAILVPLVFVLAYAAGEAVFRTWAGGVAFAAVHAVQLFSRREGSLDGTGLFELLSQPREASRALLFPAIVALAFAFAVDGGRMILASLFAASLALSAVHPTYSPYIALVFGGFLVVRLLVLRGWDPLLTRASLALGGIVVPLGLVGLVLLGPLRESRAAMPSGTFHERALETYGSFTRWGDWFGMPPGSLTREGLVVIAGLLAVPLAGFAARRLWAALVLGGTLAVLAVLLAQPLFTALSDVVSVSQSRRLPQFIPVAFAVVGACVVLSRWRGIGVGLAASASVALVLLYPGGFTDRIDPAGVGWPVWVALVGGTAALVAGVLVPRLGPSPGLWAAAAAIAFAAPVAVVGLAGLAQSEPRTRLSPSIIEAVQAETSPGDSVFSDPQSAYEIAAFAPVYINASSPSHFIESRSYRTRARTADARRFLASRALADEERLAILDRWGAEWVLIDRTRPYPEAFLQRLRLVYEDESHALYAVPQAGEAGNVTLEGR